MIQRQRIIRSTYSSTQTERLYKQTSDYFNNRCHGILRTRTLKESLFSWQDFEFLEAESARKPHDYTFQETDFRTVWAQLWGTENLIEIGVILILKTLAKFFSQLKLKIEAI